jgi:hypothetical protein
VWLIVLAVLGIWMLISAALLVGICVAASRYNQSTGQSEERYPSPDEAPELNTSPSALSSAAEWSVKPTTHRRGIPKETG